MTTPGMRDQFPPPPAILPAPARAGRIGRVSTRPRPCRWCGRSIAQEPTGRPRLYCRRSCRQRAYEQRQRVRGQDLPEDSVVLSSREIESLADRLFTARAAAEDVLTALAEGEDRNRVEQLARHAVDTARDAERLR